jgi:hypothetical protein
MTQRIIVREPWSYVLFEEQGEFILTFLMGGTVDSEFSVKLTEAEIELQRQDRTYVERLMRRLAGNRDELYGRCLLQAVWPAPTA